MPKQTLSLRCNGYEDQTYLEELWLLEYNAV
jgi:hypothetical protein